VTLFTVLAWSLPAVIALATVEGLILTFVARRAYDWRSGRPRQRMPWWGICRLRLCDRQPGRPADRDGPGSIV
jgi:hypothetical protein